MLSRESMYGYGMIKEFESLSKGTFRFKEGTLYPILHNLEKKGLVKSTWKQNSGERKRKYYEITQDGIDTLEEKSTEWNRFQQAINDVLSYR
jgi:DNA-binding PadR family transcriptional regulator